MIRKYLRLTKPGIVIGNLVTAIAGFIFASEGSFNLALFTAWVLGISLVMASACVFNNYIDRGVDAKMARTKKRALVTRDIPVLNAIVFGSVLGIAGFLLIVAFINIPTFILGIAAYVNYIIFYGITKRKSIHGTLVGTISGALPLAGGYTAATGRINEITVILFLIMVFWQMPHFYAIAMYRLKDYKSAGIPVLPAIRGISVTKFSILAYILLFFFAIIYLYVAANMGYVYLAAMSAATIFWLVYGLKGLTTNKDRVWAGKMFSISLRVLMIFSLMLSVDKFLP